MKTKILSNNKTLLMMITTVLFVFCFYANLINTNANISYDGKEDEYYESWEELSFNGESLTETQTITGGNYKITEDTRVYPSNPSDSAIIIQSNVNIYIRPGITITAIGADGFDATSEKPGTGGGAGFLVPQFANLTFYGYGSVDAVGGAGGANYKADPTTFEFSYEEIYIDSDD
ncbi:MAG: hypothetical protein ACRC5M_04285, partial [Anaeroplasmataceae bacterium]